MRILHQRPRPPPPRPYLEVFELRQKDENGEAVDEADHGRGGHEAQHRAAANEADEYLERETGGKGGAHLSWPVWWGMQRPMLWPPCIAVFCSWS